MEENKMEENKMEENKMEENEIWKPIKNYEDLYEISNFGNVRNNSGKILSQIVKFKNKNIYLNRNGNSKFVRVDKLVAEHFIENINKDDNYEIKHIDGDKTNNKVTNLEYIKLEDKEDIKDNKTVLQYSLDKKLLTTYPSIKSASLYLRSQGISHGNIKYACKGYIKTAGKFIWRYEDNPINEDLQEIWKTIKEYDKYEVSNMGKVRNKASERQLTISLRGGGYCACQLTNNEGKRTFCSIHILVATEFLAKSDEKLDCVNHKDGIKTNNNVDNLEWTTQSKNIRHAIKTGLKKTNIISVQQFTKDNKFIKKYDSITNASTQLNIENTKITAACKNRIKTAGGFIWKYTDQNKYDVIINEKDIEGKILEGFPAYIVTKEGKVYSKSQQKYISPRVHGNYHEVSLTNSDGKRTGLSLARVIAKCYLENPNNYKYVIHKNGNKFDNRVENLIWSYTSTIKT